MSYDDKKSVISDEINLLFFEKNYNKIFDRAFFVKDFLTCAYCEFFLSNLSSAKFYLECCNENISSLHLWLKVLISIIEESFLYTPGFFAVRNFLERDLHLLIENKQLNYVQKIVNAIPFFLNTNLETYKYVARVFSYHYYLQEANELLEKSKDVCYNDPETHVMLAKNYYKIQDYKLAKKHLQNCLTFAPEYYPAKDLLSKLVYI